MLRYAEDIHKTVQGLGAIVDNQAPALRLLIKNWPITLVAGIALGSRVMWRHKKGELSTFNVFVDAGFVMAPVVAFITLQKLGKDQDAAAAQQALTPLPTPPQLIQ